MRVLIAEDSPRLARTLAAGLTGAGFVTDVVVDGVQADQTLADNGFDAVVLDLALPRMEGMEVLRRLRTRGSDLPVLILTASGTTADRVRGLNAGADDYLGKPFDLDELVARLRAIARRRSGHADSTIQLGRLAYDSVSQMFHTGGAELALPRREHRILETLILCGGRPVSKPYLIDKLCSLDEVLTTDAIELYVHRLRKRLAGTGSTIRTLRGLGYLLQSIDEEPK